VAEGDGAVLEEVVGRCIEQVTFLKAHFLQKERFEEEQLQWEDTSFYQWIVGLEVCTIHPKITMGLSNTRDYLKIVY
jgi:hypothetical protein